MTDELAKRSEDPLWHVRAALRERRKELGLPQQEVATRMGLKSRTNVAELEKGSHDVGTQRLARWVGAVEAELSIRVAGGEVVVVSLEGNELAEQTGESSEPEETPKAEPVEEPAP